MSSELEGRRIRANLAEARLEFLQLLGDHLVRLGDALHGKSFLDDGTRLGVLLALNQQIRERDVAIDEGRVAFDRLAKFCLGRFPVQFRQLLSDGRLFLLAQSSQSKLQSALHQSIIVSGVHRVFD